MKSLILAIVILPWICIACNHQQVDEKEATVSQNASQIKSKKEESTNIPVQDAAKDIANAETPDAKLAAPPQQIPEKPVPTHVFTDWDKKIIKIATINLEVKNYNNYSQQVRNTIKKYGGYIAKEENFNREEKNEAVLSIKVPVQFFEQLLNELPSDDAKQLERNITSEEVTGQIIDTKARLETKKATRAKYLEFLKQGRNVEDILKVQSEINDIQEDIESAEGRLAQLCNEARYSTINLTFFEPKNGYSYISRPTYGNRVAEAFATGGKWFADLCVGLISIWPLWLAGVFIYLIIKKRRRPSLIKKSV